MISAWTLSMLEPIREYPRIVIQDALRLLPENAHQIHAFAQKNGFTVIVASTNLVFRELYEKAISDSETKKILFIDRAPAGRRGGFNIRKSPPPFYPDLLEHVAPEAYLALDLRRFLIQQTNDPGWPKAVNDSYNARLIIKNLDAVLRAHQNLRNADRERFTDNDFEKLLTYAVLGVADAAFKKLSPRDYWRIGLLNHRALEEMENVNPDITRPIKAELEKAPPPFCWFAQTDVSQVIKAFYLMVLLEQHFPNWDLLIGQIYPTYSSMTRIDRHILRKAVPDLLQLDPAQARADIMAAEQAIHQESLELLFDHELNINIPANFAAIIAKENYSLLFRSLALFAALTHLLACDTWEKVHDEIYNQLFGSLTAADRKFVETFLVGTDKNESAQSAAWSALKETYQLAYRLQKLRRKMSDGLRELAVIPPAKLTFHFFWELWNTRQINRLEYLLSAVERNLNSQQLLPLAEIPAFFANNRPKMTERMGYLIEQTAADLKKLNTRFQEFIAFRYRFLTADNDDVRLTSHFLRRCLKPHWDPEQEKCVIFIFDGMRYDIWDELFRPLLEERAEILADYPAMAIIPSETHISRKAISFGGFPDTFDTREREDVLLRAGLANHLGLQRDVIVVSPDTLGVGEAVRYRAGNLEVYIFELCDKELHHIPMKKLADGRDAPGRPLAFIYQQHIKNIIETEVMAIFRSLAPGTKLFITADHGFGLVGREPLWFERADLNEPDDCSYLHCRLRSSINEAQVPEKVRENIFTFEPRELYLPLEEARHLRKENQVFHKTYKCVAFPKAGYAFSRPGTPFKPDAYSHGGISLQELMIPMVVLRIQAKPEGIVSLGDIVGPQEVVEGEELVFWISLRPKKGARKNAADIRVDLEASYKSGEERQILPRQVLYLADDETRTHFRCQPRPEEATDEDRKKGCMTRVLTIKAAWEEGSKYFETIRNHPFTVKLNSERIIRRVPAHLGNILGLTPKSMR
jgi:hypothetical protein